MIGSLECSSLRLPRANQMYNGGLIELQVMKGYLKAIKEKLLQPVNETFCLISTDDANCCYLDRLTSGASTTQCQPAKRAI